jgi:hypothetical protein
MIAQRQTAGEPLERKPEELLVSVIERNSGCELRVYAVRHKGRVSINISAWYRNPFAVDDTWRPDRRPWNGGALLRPAEIPLVADAMQTAVERAAALGWEVR